MQTPFACALKTRKDYSRMQTYSLGFSGSLFPSTKSTQQTQTQAKPYASLASQDTVHFGANEKKRLEALKTQCMAHGLTENGVKDIETKALQDPKVKNAVHTKKTILKYLAQIRLYREKLKEIYENASGEYDAIGESE